MAINARQLEAGRTMERAAHLEAQALGRFQVERGVPPLTAAIAAVTLAGRIVRLASSDDDTELRNFVERLCIILMMHARCGDDDANTSRGH